MVSDIFPRWRSGEYPRPSRGEPGFNFPARKLVLVWFRSSLRPWVRFSVMSSRCDSNTVPDYESTYALLKAVVGFLRVLRFPVTGKVERAG